MNGLPVSAGWTWLKQGAQLFRKQSGALTSLLFAIVFILLLLSQVPFLGPFVAHALTPALSLGFMAACLLAEQSQRVSPAVLLTGLRKPAVFSLIKVGLVYLAVALLLAGLIRLMLSAEFMAQFRVRIDPARPPVIKLSDALTVLGLGLVNLAALVITCYAAPLIYWQKMGIGKALFFSAVGVMRSIWAFLVLLMSALGILFVGMFLIVLILGQGTFGTVVLMWMMFLCVLVLNCAVYCAYRQIFGVPDAAPGTGVSPP